MIGILFESDEWSDHKLLAEVEAYVGVSNFYWEERDHSCELPSNLPGFLRSLFYHSLTCSGSKLFVFGKLPRADVEGRQPALTNYLHSCCCAAFFCHHLKRLSLFLFGEKNVFFGNYKGTIGTYAT